ncbi:Matrix metalloproteinase-21 [Chionoecetes opilio]|uniref:Matrix metalloproteinase-21 n=1 Tax=Chionoecetes opilio TaxID=41210 RepID=A0A8J5CYJ8_CHIOP|nr:Matrix metalloproteinase-21 [Chionoecetes opilio]
MESLMCCVGVRCRYNRTRFGDPLDVRHEWGGLEDYIDGYAHVWTRTQDIHLMFKGALYYLYDPRTERVLPGYPRRIAHDFHGPPTPKRPRGRSIPNNIDTVYFDKRDENLYFIKGKKVYGYEVSKGSKGCCLPGYPRRVREEFPPAHPSIQRLPRALDAAYYSYTDQKLYFLKDRLFWEVSTFHPHDKHRNNSVVGPFYVYDKWRDICDTDIDPLDASTVN